MAEVVSTASHPSGVTLLYIRPKAYEEAWAGIRNIRMWGREGDLKIPRIIDTIHRMDDSMYVVMEGAPRTFREAYFGDPRKFGPETLDQIARIFSTLHEIGTWLNLARSVDESEHAYTIIDLFGINSSDEISFVDLSGISMIPNDQDTGPLVSVEVAKIQVALNDLFVNHSVRFRVTGSYGSASSNECPFATDQWWTDFEDEVVEEWPLSADLFAPLVDTETRLGLAETPSHENLLATSTTTTTPVNVGTTFSIAL